VPDQASSYLLLLLQFVIFRIEHICLTNDLAGVSPPYYFGMRPPITNSRPADYLEQANNRNEGE